MTIRDIVSRLSVGERDNGRVIEGTIGRIGVSPNLSTDNGVAYVFRLRHHTATYRFNFLHAKMEQIEGVRDTFALTQPGDCVRFRYDPAKKLQVWDFENLTFGGTAQAVASCIPEKGK